MQRFINQEGLNLIKKFEGLSLRAYKDVVGVTTIGYGHTGPGLKMGSIITSDQAEDLLLDDLEYFCKVVNDCVKVQITNNQFAALVSFTFNLGGRALLTSTLLKKLNAGDIKGASSEFLRWNKAGGKVMAGLTGRRSAERDLFLKA